MDLKKLMEVGMVANKRVTDSEIRKQRILDAKAKMAEKRGEEATGEKLNRIGDSARPTRTPMRGVAQRRAVATQARMQDSHTQGCSVSKSYHRTILRQQKSARFSSSLWTYRSMSTLSLSHPTNFNPNRCGRRFFPTWDLTTYAYRLIAPTDHSCIGSVVLWRAD